MNRSRAYTIGTIALAIFGAVGFVLIWTAQNADAIRDFLAR